MRDHLIKEQNFTFLRCHTLYNSIVIFQNIYCRMVHQIQILIDWSLCLLSQVKCLKKKASNPVEVSLSFLFTILQKYFNVNLFLFCFLLCFRIILYSLFFILYFFFDLIYCVWSLDVIQKTMITHQKKKTSTKILHLYYHLKYEHHKMPYRFYTFHETIKNSFTN